MYVQSGIWLLQCFKVNTSTCNYTVRERQVVQCKSLGSVISRPEVRSRTDSWVILNCKPGFPYFKSNSNPLTGLL